MKPPKATLADKLAAMADPKRNDNPHERAVAAAKLAALKAGGRTPGPRPPGPMSAARYAREHGLDPRLFRKKLRAAGKHAPYSWDDMERVR